MAPWNLPPDSAAEPEPCDSKDSAVLVCDPESAVDDPTGTGDADAGPTAQDADVPVTAADGAGDPDGAAAETGEAVPDGAGEDAVPAPTRRSRLVGMFRRPQGRREWLVAGTAVVVVIALVLGGLMWWRPADLPEGIAFRVSGQEVSVEELGREVDTLRALYGLQQPTAEPELDRFRRDIAQASAVGLLLERVAADRGVAISDKQAQDVLTRYIDQFYGGGTDSRTKFVQALGTVGTSEPAVLREIKRQLVVRQLFTDVTQGISISDEDLRRAFTERQAELTTPDRRELHNIVLTTREQADQLMAELVAGADFALLAAERSLDTSSKAEGGRLGTLTADQLEKGYADAAFAAPVGGVFGPVETRFGWNVGKVVAALPPEPAVFEKVGEPLRQRLGLDRATAAWRDWLSGQITEADVAYADEYRPANPNALPSETLRDAPVPGAVPGVAPLPPN